MFKDRMMAYYLKILERKTTFFQSGYYGDYAGKWERD